MDLQAKQRTPCQDAPAAAAAVCGPDRNTNNTELLLLTGEDDDPSTMTNSAIDDNVTDAPEAEDKEQIRPTTSAFQQKRVKI